jgi:hypothetical protein
MAHDLHDSTVLTVNPDHVAGEVAGDAVILSLSNGIYYSLNEVGTSVWQLVKQGRNVGEVVAAIHAAFDVDLDRCRRDVVEVLGRLIDARLLEIGDGPAA